MTIPNIDEFNTFTNIKEISGKSYDINLNKIIQILTSGIYDVKFNSLIVDNITAGNVIDRNPIGSIFLYGGAYSPAGFLFANGAAISRTTYANLFSIYGIVFGVGDGSTTFNLPDLREAYPVGIGTRGSGVIAHDAFTLGQFKDDQMQGHWHSIANESTPANTLRSGGIAATGAVNATYLGISGTEVKALDAITDGVNGTPRTGTTTRAKGLGLNFIIKY